MMKWILCLALFGGVICSAQTIVRVPEDYPSIQAAINAAPSVGWTIEVAPGTWVGNLNFLSKGIVLRAVGNMFNTTLQGTGTDSVVFMIDTPPGTRIEGFKIMGGRGHPWPSSYGFDYYGGGVYLGASSSNAVSRALVRNCRITGNGNPPITATFAGGAYASGPNTELRMEHTVLDGNYAWASGGGTLVDWLGLIRMDRCVVYNNSDTSFFGWQSGIGGANQGDTYVKDCIVWGNAPGPIAAFGPPYNVGVDFFVSYTDVTGGFSGVGNLDANPLFVNAAAGDFGLLPGSPCINAGDPSSPLDPDGSRADMGAYPLPGVVPQCGLTNTCLAMSSPAPTGWWSTLSLRAQTPNAPIIVLADQHTSTHAIGSYGTTSLALGPELWVIADATGVLGGSITTPYLNATGGWFLTMPIPTGPNVLAATAYAEAYVFDPTAPNGLFHQSNLLAVTFGL